MAKMTPTHNFMFTFLLTFYLKGSGRWSLNSKHDQLFGTLVSVATVDKLTSFFIIISNFVLCNAVLCYAECEIGYPVE